MSCNGQKLQLWRNRRRQNSPTTTRPKTTVTQNKHDQDRVRLVGRKPTTFNGGYPEDLSKWPEDLLWRSNLFFPN